MSGLFATRVILGAELLALRHRLLKRGPVRLTLLAIFVVAAAVFIGGGAFAVGAGAGLFLASAVDPLLVGGFTGLSVLMLVVGFPTVIATFFVGRDLLQLALAPVHPIEIFAARLSLAMSANLMVSFILVAVVFGIGAGAGAPLAYFVLAVPLILVQVLVITSLQAILMSIVLRWVPARMARDVAAAVAGLTGAGLYLAWNLSLRQSFSGRSRPDFEHLNAVIQRIDWLPPAWPGHALGALISETPARPHSGSRSRFFSLLAPSRRPRFCTSARCSRVLECSAARKRCGRERRSAALQRCLSAAERPHRRLR